MTHPKIMVRPKDPTHKLVRDPESDLFYCYQCGTHYDKHELGILRITQEKEE